MTTINNKKNGTTFAVTGLERALSAEAFVEYYKLYEAYLAEEDISNNWRYNPIFLIALYERFKRTSPYDAECVQNVILSMDWLFDGASVQTFYRKSVEHMTVLVKQYKGNEELLPKEYTNSNQCFEVIRDMCLPMIYNW